jgi:hypothetical protein
MILNPEDVYSFKTKIELNSTNEIFLTNLISKLSFTKSKDKKKQNKFLIIKNKGLTLNTSQQLKYIGEINILLNKVTSNNISSLINELQHMSFTNEEETLYIFTLLTKNIFNDENYMKNYINLLIEVYKNIDLPYNILNKFINKLEEKYEEICIDKTQENTEYNNTIISIGLLNNIKIIKKSLIELIVEYFINNNMYNYLYLLLVTLNNNKQYLTSELHYKINNTNLIGLKHKILIENLYNVTNTVITNDECKEDMNNIFCENVLEEFLEYTNYDDILVYSKKININVLCYCIFKNIVISNKNDTLLKLLTYLIDKHVVKNTNIITTWKKIQEDIDELSIDYIIYSNNIKLISDFITNISKTSN